MKRKCLKILLSIFLFLGMSSVVNAEEKSWSVSSGITESEVVSGATYTVFSGKGEVNINESAAMYFKIAEGADITINLNGYTISTSEWTDVAIIDNMGKLTINGSGTLINNANDGDWADCLIRNHPGANLILNGGTYTKSKNNRTGGHSGYIIKNLGNLIINEGTTLDSGDTNKGSSLIASGWDMNYATEPHTNNLNYLYDENVKINLTINGGTFIGGKRAVTSDPGDNTVINDGKFLDGSSGVLKAAGKVQINGGEFTAISGKKVLDIEGDGKIEVINGDFNQDVSSYISADSEMVNEDGIYSVVFIPADYSRIGEMFMEINLKGEDYYTSKSLKTFDDIVQKIDWDLGKSKQAVVDVWIAELEVAFANLKKAAVVDKIKNPATSNNSLIYILSGIIMVLGIGGCIIYRKKLFN